MTIAELLLQDFDAEIGSTRRLLERVPDDNPDYKPHEKSFTLGKLTMHVATLPHFGKTILTTPAMDMANPTGPRPDLTFHTRDAALAAFADAASDCRSALAGSSDDSLNEKWQFSFGEYLISNQPRSASFRLMFFNHMIHHRGQLGVYLRLMNVPIPGMYGPSADEPFNPGK